MKAFLILISGLLFSNLLPLAAATTDKPNVLLVIVDDLTTTLGCYNDSDASTPHIDSLAARGVKFEHAYTQFALCNPSRCSFLTGCYPERTKVLDLVTSIRKNLPDVVTLPQLFKNAGYSTGRIGKVFHVADPKTKLDVEIGAPLHKDGEILEEAKLGERTEGDLSDPPHKSPKENSLYNREWASSKRPAEDFTDYQIASDAIGTLESFSSAKSGTGEAKPFFLAVGFIRPHTPYVAPSQFFNVLNPAQIAMPAFYAKEGEDLSHIPKAALRPNNNVFRFAAPSPIQAREARRAYLAATSFVDSQIGRLLAKLKDLQLEDNTIILLTGDHGYQLGEHGLWAKQTLFEEGTHVPLIVTAPGIKPASARGLVEQVDIYPTLAGLAGLEVPRHVQGTSMQSLLSDPSQKGKTVVFSTMVSTHTHLVGHSVRTDRFRYIEWDGGKGGMQLYDHETDPHELHNISDIPQQAERIARMKSRLAAHLQLVNRN